ncbi:MAG TPA: hypothetical protein VF527_02490 [Pyrinomonadaceae bacterium]
MRREHDERCDALAASASRQVAAQMMPEARRSSTFGMSAASMAASTALSIEGSETMRLACLLTVVSKRLRASRALPKVSSREVERMAKIFASSVSAAGES